MTGNHAAYALAPSMPAPLAIFLFALGGLTFPIMAFLITEGFARTSSFSHYLRRLIIFAIVSQVPYTLLWGLQGNVFFTLTAGLVVLWAYRSLKSKIAFFCVIAAACLLTLECDWGFIGPLMVFLFHIEREEGTRGIVICTLVLVLTRGIPALTNVFAYITAPDANTGLAAITGWEIAGADTLLSGYSILLADPAVLVWGEFGYAIIGASIAGFLLTQYKGRRGLPMKWSFYVYYPAHLLVIWVFANFWLAI